MQKRFCDKCGKEIIKEIPINVSISQNRATKPDDFYVCIECNNKFIKYADLEYDYYTYRLLCFFKNEE